MDPKILIIDNLPENLETMKEWLEGEDFKSIEMIDNAEVAKKRAKETHFDVIVTDMVMVTETDGYELVKYFRELSQLVIVITAHPDDNVLKRCMRAGAYDYIDKKKKGQAAYDELVASIREGLQTLKQKNIVYNKDSLFVRDNFQDLRKEYKGKFIAVLDEKIVDNDENYKKLKDRMEEKYRYSRVFMVNIP